MSNPGRVDATQVDALPRFSPTQLLRFCERVLVAVGVPVEDARIVADGLVDAQLRGVATHGVQNLSIYVHWIRSGVVNPRPNVTRVMDTGPLATLDGDMGFGLVVATQATDLALDKAGTYGVGTVVARHCGHTAALAYYANRLAAHNCIGIVISQGGAVMAPTGGIGKLVGNNPVAYAFPTRRGFPLTLDMALSVVAGARVVMHMRNGWLLPTGWVRDAAGQPTVDPHAFTDHIFERDGGTLEPIGGYKGYGLALAHDILAGVLSGGRYGANLGGSGNGVYVQALDIVRFLPLDTYYDRLDQLIDQLKSAQPTSGSGGVFVPGEHAHTTRMAYLRDGIPLDAGSLAELAQVAEVVGIEPVSPETGTR